MNVVAPFRTIVIFVTLSIIGFALIPRLPVQWQPSGQSSHLSVGITWANASPSTIEQEVITPLEGAFNLVQGIKSIYSIAGNGNGLLRLEVDEEVDLAYLRFEVTAKIRQLYSKLPEGVSFPQVITYNPTLEQQERPILTYSLSGMDALSALYRYASEVISPKLALQRGIQSISVIGGNQSEWRIIYNEPQMKALKLSKEDLVTALQQQFLEEGLGITKVGHQQLTVRLNNEATLSEKQQLATLPIKKVEGRLVRLNELADIILSDQPPQQYYRINGQNSIRLLFYPQQGVNTLQLARQIKDEIKSLRTLLKAGYQLRLEDDTTEYLSKELQKIAQRTLLSIMVLLLFVLIAYRRWRYLWIVLLSLAVNLGLAIILYEWLSVELHLYALAGITVSFSIIIDNSIVMIHHLKHHGNLSVFPALLASTLTTISALSVIWFLPDKWQINLLDFAKVISINLGVSLLVALFFIPALMKAIHLNQDTRQRSYKSKKRQVKFNQVYYNILSILLKRKRMVITGVVLLFGLPVFLLPTKIDQKDWYNTTLGNEWYLDNIKPIFNRVLGGTLRLFVWYVYEGASYREADETILHVEGRMPPGATLTQMDQVFHQIEQYLRQYPGGIKQFTIQISSGEYGSMQIFFNENYRALFPNELKDQLTVICLNMGGLNWNIYGVGKGFSSGSATSPPRFKINMMGYNKDELEIQALHFADKLLKHPRIQDVSTDANLNSWEKKRNEYELSIDRQSFVQKGVQPVQLLALLEQFNNSLSSDARLPSGITVRFINSSLRKKDLWVLKHELQSIDSSKISFSAFSSLEKKKVSSNIHKENQQYIKTVEFEYTGSEKFGNRYLEEVIEEMQKEMPLGYSIKRTTLNLNNEQNRNYSLFLLVISLIGMVCAIVFESVKQSFNIILLIPISFIGIFLSFYWFDFPFDQGGYTAFIFLSGIVVNSLILIINDFNYFRNTQPKRSPLSLYIKAFNHKIIPILLTIFSTSLGLIPFLIHGQQEVFWFSFAIASISGLLFSILVITFLIPIFFLQRRSSL